MPKYLFIGRYSPEGARGVLKEGGTKRREAAEQVLASVGGRLESIHWAFGEGDFYVVADMPDNVAASAAALRVAASGAVGIKTVVLMTADEVDQATQRSAEYRPPGG
ncbi:MAG TPA: GYD domain-containing protein [Candidatus Limnocylindrales bacterium]|nr:GYD domain-containing protein [Candidatus Limnocylindrales bacterium]